MLNGKSKLYCSSRVRESVPNDPKKCARSSWQQECELNSLFHTLTFRQCWFDILPIEIRQLGECTNELDFLIVPLACILLEQALNHEKQISIDFRLGQWWQCRRWLVINKLLDAKVWGVECGGWCGVVNKISIEHCWRDGRRWRWFRLSISRVFDVLRHDFSSPRRHFTLFAAADTKRTQTFVAFEHLKEAVIATSWALLFSSCLHWSWGWVANWLRRVVIADFLVDWLIADDDWIVSKINNPILSAMVWNFFGNALLSFDRLEAFETFTTAKKAFVFVAFEWHHDAMIAATSTVLRTSHARTHFDTIVWLCRDNKTTKMRMFLILDHSVISKCSKSIINDYVIFSVFLLFMFSTLKWCW